MMEINKSLNHTWKVTNVVMQCNSRTDVHTHTQTHTYKEKVYNYNNKTHINCGSEKKYKQFYNNQFGSYTVTPIEITLYQLQYKVTCKCFKDFVCRINYYIFDDY